MKFRKGIIYKSICAECGKNFMGLSSRANTCSEKCKKTRQRHTRRRFVKNRPDLVRAARKKFYDAGKWRKSHRKYYAKNKNELISKAKKRSEKITDLITVLRSEMPELIKEFGL